MSLLRPETLPAWLPWLLLTLVACIPDNLSIYHATPGSLLFQIPAAAGLRRPGHGGMREMLR